MSENTQKCPACGSQQNTVKIKDRFYCPACASFIMAELKRRYYAGESDLGWEIQELWEQLKDPADLWIGDADSFLEADEIMRTEYEDMALYYRAPDASALLRNFVREKLNGDIRNFTEFNFQTLKYDTLYGCSDPDKFDCDNTFIIRAIYVLLFSDVFPDMQDWREITTGKSYRGDTVFTFHTIFGRPVPDKPGHFNGIDRYLAGDEPLYDRIREFHRNMARLGNYVVLPNHSVKLNDRFVTLNTYRGTNEWRDYMDQFLLALEPCLTAGDRRDETLYKLVHQRNRTAFAGYTTQQGFTRLVQNLLLDDFLDANGRAKNIFADSNGKVCFHWDFTRPAPEIYLAGVINYLDNAERIITDRTQRMIEKLRKYC